MNETFEVVDSRVETECNFVIIIVLGGGGGGGGQLKATLLHHLQAKCIILHIITIT